MIELLQSILADLAKKPLQNLLFGTIVGFIFGLFVLWVVGKFNKKYLSNRDDLKYYENKLEKIRIQVHERRDVFDEWESRDMLEMNELRLKEVKKHLSAFRATLIVLCIVLTERVIIIIPQIIDIKIISFEIRTLIFISVILILVLFGSLLFKLFDCSDLLSNEDLFISKKKDICKNKMFGRKWKR